MTVQFGFWGASWLAQTHVGNNHCQFILWRKEGWGVLFPSVRWRRVRGFGVNNFPLRLALLLLTPLLVKLQPVLVTSLFSLPNHGASISSYLKAGGLAWAKGSQAFGRNGQNYIRVQLWRLFDVKGSSLRVERTSAFCQMSTPIATPTLQNNEYGLLNANSKRTFRRITIGVYIDRSRRRVESLNTKPNARARALLPRKRMKEMCHSCREKITSLAAKCISDNGTVPRRPFFRVM